jgi:hypothetical protein
MILCIACFTHTNLTFLGTYSQHVAELEVQYQLSNLQDSICTSVPMLFPAATKELDAETVCNCVGGTQVTGFQARGGISMQLRYQVLICDVFAFTYQK